MNILETINELGKKAKDASIQIRVLQKEKKMAAYQCLEKNIDKNADHILSSNKLDIEKCFLQANISNKIRNFIKKKAEELKLDFFDLIKQKGDIRSLMIRSTTTKEIMILIQFYNFSEKSKKLLQCIESEFKEIQSILYVINNKANDTIYDLDIKCFSGVNYITEKINDLSFKILAKSFFQTNSFQTGKLYNIVKKFADLKGNETVYDLYCGIGTISLFLAKDAKKIVGIETVEDAVISAKSNAKLNNISNCEFIKGDVKDIINKPIRNHKNPDIIIVDPPRNGLDKSVIHSLVKLSPDKIIYVSCNSSTQARDIIDLKGFYKLKTSQAIDMFPQTCHVENVVLLEKI